jgi:hypothetical protein
VEVAGGGCFWLDITVVPPSFDPLHGAGLEPWEGGFLRFNIPRVLSLLDVEVTVGRVQFFWCYFSGIDHRS